MLAMEKQAHEGREECGVIVNQGGGKEDKREAEVISLRAEMAMLSQDLIDLRSSQ